MCDIKFSRFFSLAAPRFDELSILIELQDSRIAVCSRRVPLRNEYVSVGGDGDVIGLIEQMRRVVPIAALPFSSEGEEHLSLRIEFHDGMSADIGGPDAPVFIDAQSMRPSEKPIAK